MNTKDETELQPTSARHLNHTVKIDRVTCTIKIV